MKRLKDDACVHNVIHHIHITFNFSFDPKRVSAFNFAHQRFLNVFAFRDVGALPHAKAPLRNLFHSQLRITMSEPFVSVNENYGAKSIPHECYELLSSKWMWNNSFDSWKPMLDVLCEKRRWASKGEIESPLNSISWSVLSDLWCNDKLSRSSIARRCTTSLAFLKIHYSLQLIVWVSSLFVSATRDGFRTKNQ